MNLQSVDEKIRVWRQNPVLSPLFLDEGDEHTDYSKYFSHSLIPLGNASALDIDVEFGRNVTLGWHNCTPMEVYFETEGHTSSELRAADRKKLQNLKQQTMIFMLTEQRKQYFRKFTLKLGIKNIPTYGVDMFLSSTKCMAIQSKLPGINMKMAESKARVEYKNFAQEQKDPYVILLAKVRHLLGTYISMKSQIDPIPFNTSIMDSYQEGHLPFHIDPSSAITDLILSSYVSPTWSTITAMSSFIDDMDMTFNFSARRVKLIWKTLALEKKCVHFQICLS